MRFATTAKQPETEVDRLQLEVSNLKRELELAVSECCNAYFDAGHFDRVAKLYGIELQEETVAAP